MKNNTKSAGTEKKHTIDYLVVTSLEVTRAHSWGEGKGASFDMKLNGISLYNCRVVEGKKGDFISFPSYKANDGKYYSHYWMKLSEETTKEIISKVEEML